MPTTDPRIDAYIEKSHDFAKPILLHLRRLIHEAAPNILETLKWGMPSFEYKGLVCGMAAFKKHCTLMFWKEALLKSIELPAKSAMGSFGRITSLADLPKDTVIKKLVEQAVELNAKGIKVNRSRMPPEKELVIPDILLEALARDEKAAETFNRFSYSCRKEYVEWIAEAKTEPTRMKRLATTLEWLGEGKKRNWKYERC